MTRDEVLERFCKLASEVGSCHFGSTYAADCFCGRGGTGRFERFEEPVMEFIERAVAQAMGNAAQEAPRG